MAGLLHEDIPVVSPVLGPDDVDLVIPQVSRLLQHTLLARAVHSKIKICIGTKTTFYIFHKQNILDF